MFGSLDLSGVAPYALTWLASINDATGGWLDIMLAIMSTIPMLTLVWRYLHRSGGGTTP